MKKSLALIMILTMVFAAALAESPEVPAGVVPVTWEVTPERLMIDTPEARALYERIVAGDYPSMEELKAHPVVKQLDALAEYYYGLYGNTVEIDSEQRDELRDQLRDWFLTLGSARRDRIDEGGKPHYVYDGPLKKEYSVKTLFTSAAGPPTTETHSKQASERRKL